MSKLGDVVKKDVIEKAVYDKLVAKVKKDDTSRFVLKTKYQTDKEELENIPDVSDFVKKTKLTELENKIPDVRSLVKKTDYDTKISELEKEVTDHNHDRCITSSEFNNLVAGVLMQD